MSRARRLALAGATIALAALACTPAVTPLPPRELPPPAPPAPERAPVPRPDPPALEPAAVRIPVRVAVATAADGVVIDASGAWEARTVGSGAVIVRAAAGEEWRAARSGSQQVLAGPGGRQVRVTGRVVFNPVSPETVLRANGRRYRGDLALIPSDTGILLLNELDVEEYLRGVVPLEIGNRPAADLAAAQAQAIAARSYTLVRVRARRNEPYDIRASVLDQVYGGMDAERAVTSEAVVTTAGLGIFYDGELVDTPYHSTCGGSTASVPEVWVRQREVAYLQAVSDRIPGTDRYWCDSSATFRWTRTMQGRDLNATVARYLRSYVAGAPVNPGVVRQLTVSGHTASGRVAALTVMTERGRYVLRGNDIRFAIREPGGRVLNSTSFTVTTTRAGSGAVTRAVFRGSGNGHGIGMCQWGAIGRARAGFSARDILAAYYPGTTISLINSNDLRTAR